MNHTTMPRRPTPPAADSAVPGAGRTVIAIAVTAGEMAALAAFFRHVDPRTDVVFLVMLDAAPERTLDCLVTLQQAVDLPVQLLADRLRPRPGHLYIAPGVQTVGVAEGMIGTDAARDDTSFVDCVDQGLTECAQAYGEYMFALNFMAGRGVATQGWHAVRQAGGIVMAASDVGPCAAADICMPSDQLPARIRLIRQVTDAYAVPRSRHVLAEPHTPESVAHAEAEEWAWRDVLTLLCHHARHDFRRYRRDALMCLVTRRLRIACVAGLPAYRDYLQGRPAEAHALLAELASGGPSLFDTRPSVLLDTATCQGLVDLASQRGDSVLRAWNVDCGRGDDSYAIGILLLDAASQPGAAGAVQVFATASDPSALVEARAGRYPASRVAGLPRAVADGHFTVMGDQATASRKLRGAIVFAAHDLLQDPPLSKLHLVAWRNRLSLLTHSIQRAMLRILHYALVPGGYLLLGENEGSDAMDEWFVSVDRRRGVYRARLTGANAQASALQRHAPAESAYKSSASGEIYRRALQRDALPSLITRHDYDIVHLCDRVGRFLTFAGGEPTRQLLTVIDPALRGTLRAALYEATLSRRPVYSPQVSFRRGGRDLLVSIAVKPFTDTDSSADLLLVMFDEVEADPVADALPPEAPVRRIESHLQSVRTGLRRQGDASHGMAPASLHAANEALQIINEELRTATEELKAREAELQAANQEFCTLVSELEREMELAVTDRDHLRNLRHASESAILFVDRQLSVRFYTPACRTVFDVGLLDACGALPEVVQGLSYPSLAEDAAAVMRTLRRHERQVTDRAGRSYLVLLAPYVTSSDRVTGVVVTLRSVVANPPIARPAAAVLPPIDMSAPIASLLGMPTDRQPDR
jgi:two-component system CheB/CheR fusion protein